MSSVAASQHYSLAVDEWTIAVLVLFVCVTFVFPCVLLCGRIRQRYFKSRVDYLLCQ